MKSERGLAPAGLFVCLAGPSLAVVGKFTGLAGLLLYVAGVALAIAVMPGTLLPAVRAHMTEQQARRWSVMVGVLLVAAFAVFFPIAKSGLA